MASLFVDANIFLRHLLQDHDEHSPRATDFIGRLERRELLAETSPTVMAEVVFVLERTYKIPKEAVQRGILALMALPGLTIAGGESVQDALELCVARNVSYGDAFNAVQMVRRGLDTVVSFDRDFDRIPGVTRIEP